MKNVPGVREVRISLSSFHAVLLSLFALRLFYRCWK